MSKFLFITNDCWFFESHRLPIAERLISLGHEVFLIAKADHSSDRIRSIGVQLHNWKVEPRGNSPLNELKSALQLYRLISKLRPHVVHLITIKPVLYGGLISRILRVPSVVYAVNGLGAVFVDSSRRSKLIRFFITRVYKLAINHRNSVVIFQNHSDKEKLLDLVSLNKLDSVIVRGSGVDLDKYKVVNRPSGTPVVCMAARLLRDKGIYEYLDASKRVKERGYVVDFWLAGALLAEGNPASLTPSELDAIKDEYSVQLLGHRSDIADLFTQCSIIVLPSWREGLPKVLVEAAACGRAVVTTDVPGCRDAIEPGVTGTLVELQNPESLADAIIELLDNPTMLDAYGVSGRHLAESVFDITKIVDQHIDIYQGLASTSNNQYSVT